MMKKRTFTIILTAISIVAAKSAMSDMILDPALASANLGGMGQTISENVELGIQQYNTVQKIRTQGFNLNSLSVLMNSPLGKLGKGYILNLTNNYRMNAKIQDTKGKSLDIMEKEAELDTQARKAENEEKLRVEKAQLAEDKSILSAKKQALSELKRTLDQREQEYKNITAQDNYDIQKYTYALTLYIEAKNKYDEEVKNIESLEETIKTTTSVIALLEEENKKIGTDQDQKWVDNQRRIQITKEQGEDVGLITAQEDNSDKNNDWGKMEDLKNFSIDEITYKEFIKSYFLDPEETMNIEASKDALQLNQSKGDKILRQRKELIIQTIKHLLQVTASVRREIPVREAYAKNTYEQAIEGEDELNAIVQYSNTRIEQSRALLLYAKLQAAKLQYQAARQIDKVCGLYKQGDITENSYSTFDLGKYILTKEYLDKTKEASNGEKNETMQSIDVKPVQ